MIDWPAVPTTVVSVVREIGNAISAGLGAALALYVAVPPFRRFVDGRIAHHFDKQLETHKHELTVLADVERARLQRSIQNSALVVARKHEVFRRMFQRLHFAMGKVSHLFGSGTEPAYMTYDRADVEHYMRALRFPGTVRTSVLDAWDTDRKVAIEQLRTTTRHAELENAERAFARAWNYYLGNELYLPDPIAQKAHQAFQPLQKTLNLAKNPGGRGDYSGWATEASDRVTELKNLLRAELRVVDEEAPRKADGQG
jgi:hypothetical protein